MEHCRRERFFLYVAVYVMLGAEDYNIRPYADAEQFFTECCVGFVLSSIDAPRKGTNVT